MKKFLILLSVLILVGCFPITLSAQETNFSIKAESITAMQGDTVAVKFSFQNNPGISLFTFELNYDKTQLTLKELNGNSLMGGSFIDNVNDDFILWMSSSEDLDFNGTVFTAIFEIAKNAHIGKTDISVSLPYQDGNVLNYNGDDIEIQVVSGYVDIQSAVRYGDVNNDGEINSLDLASIRIVLLSNNINYIDYIVCDINADNEINIIDLVRLKKFLAGIDVPLGPQNTETQTVELLSQPAYSEQKNTAY